MKTKLLFYTLLISLILNLGLFKLLESHKRIYNNVANIAHNAFIAGCNTGIAESTHELKQFTVEDSRLVELRIKRCVILSNEFTEKFTSFMNGIQFEN